MAEQFVVAGLARARVEWFRAVASWSMSGALPIEFVGCLSVEELRALADGGRVLSAALLDAGVPRIDRDLVAHLVERGIAPVFVESAGVRRQWRELGAVATLPTGFRREQLLDALRATATPVSAGELPGPTAATDHGAGPPRGPLVAVCGPGGTGASSVAIALAQGLAREPVRPRSRLPGLTRLRSLVTGGAHRAGAPGAAADTGDVVLADLCRRADQAALHDAREVVPGVQELVEAHRTDRPTTADVRRMTFRVPERGYHLLLGLRRASLWTAIRPRAFAAALDGLRVTFETVVADIEADVESEREGGSADVEERNAMARIVATNSWVVLVVGQPGLSGMTGLVRTMRDLRAHGVEAGRMLPVCTPGPRSPAARAEYRRTLTALLDWPTGEDAPSAVLFLPACRLDSAVRDGAPMPQPVPGLLAAAVRQRLACVSGPDRLADGAVPVTAGSLGLS